MSSPSTSHDGSGAASATAAPPHAPDTASAAAPQTHSTAAVRQDLPVKRSPSYDNLRSPSDAPQPASDPSDPASSPTASFTQPYGAYLQHSPAEQHPQYSFVQPALSQSTAPDSPIVNAPAAETTLQDAPAFLNPASSTTPAPAPSIPGVQPAPTPTPHAETETLPPAAITNQQPPVPNVPTTPVFLRRWALHASDSQFNALSGAIGGFTSGIITCPLDVIKTKLQAQGGFSSLNQGGTAGQPGLHHHRIYKGLVGTASVILRDEGVRGLYRGLGPIIMGYLPTWAVWFTVYNKSKLWLAEQHHNNFVISFWSSIIAGASSTIVTNPIWVIKTRLMSQMPSHDRSGFSAYPRGTTTPTSRPTLHTPWHYNSTLDAARKMYTTEGILSFYSGLTPALLGLTHVAVQFPAYEFLKTKFTGLGMGESDSPEGKSGVPQWVGVLSATVLSKIMASTLTYPHEVIRTRLQTQRRPAASAQGAATGGAQAVQAPPRYKGVIKTFRTILREEGWRAFYAGLGTNMMRAVPAATVTMMTYEHMMRTLKHAQHEAQQLESQLVP